VNGGVLDLGHVEHLSPPRAGCSRADTLLSGALRLEPDEIRREGAGQLLGRVIESEALESLALSGGFLSFISGIELAMAGR